jgi:hypothetical protein
MSISEAKALPDGTPVALDGNIVSADFGDLFYMQAADKTSGIHVDALGPDEGTEVSVAGKMDTVGGERVLSEVTVVPGDPVGVPRPRLMGNSALGGAELNELTPGVTGASGTNNIGLLVATTGRVTHADVGFCYFDDGSAIQDGSGYFGVKLDTTRLTTLPAEDQYIKVIGISGVELFGSDAIRVLKPRGDTDVTIWP